MIKAIITDIEGTTTPISFVRDVLFPYALPRLRPYLEQHPEQAEMLRQEILFHVKQSFDFNQMIFILEDWAKRDQKIAPLKTLQGWIWEEGYRTGQYTAPVYTDVPPALSLWQKQGIPVYVYSSGSVAAQKLLFAHTDHGDLTAYFSGFYDTLIGNKTESSSYLNIASAINQQPADILFLSDMQAEIQAAEQAGLQAVQVIRPGTLPAFPHTITSFAEVRL
jgi:enolase-phosphatase E1